MKFVIAMIGAICFIIGFVVVITIKAVNEAAVFMDDSFRWGNGRDY